MKKGIKQIGLAELGEIKAYLSIGLSIPQIAKKIKRDKTTLYRLFENNGIDYKKIKYRYVGGKGGKVKRIGIKKIPKEESEYLKKAGKRKISFIPLTIYNKRAKRKSIASRRYCRVEPGSKEEKYILEKIKLYWSPKQISGRYESENLESTLSHQTIYSFMYSNHKNLIYKYFRRKGKKYKHDRKAKYQLSNRKMIAERPKIVDLRDRIGDWEGDTIVGIRNGNKAVLLTNVERKSGYLLVEKLEDRTAEKVLDKTTKLFKKIPKEKKYTITYDNGKEFGYHEYIEKNTGLKVYFANPYHSRERGINENTNGLIRQFLPKGTDFTKISEYKIKKIMNLINDRPRERLGFLSPKETFEGI